MRRPMSCSCSPTCLSLLFSSCCILDHISQHLTFDCWSLKFWTRCLEALLIVPGDECWLPDWCWGDHIVHFCLFFGRKHCPLMISSKNPYRLTHFNQCPEGPRLKFENLLKHQSFKWKGLNPFYLFTIIIYYLVTSFHESFVQNKALILSFPA